MGGNELRPEPSCDTDAHEAGYLTGSLRLRGEAGDLMLDFLGNHEVLLAAGGQALAARMLLEQYLGPRGLKPPEARSLPS
jgi:hypothetical protein